MMLNHPITPIKGFVHESFCYNGDPTKTEWLPAEVIALNFYPTDCISLMVRMTGDGIENGSVFNNIPFHAFSVQTTDVRYELTDLVYYNNPSYDVCAENVFTLPKDVKVFLKHRDQWVAGTYLYTIDWPNDNLLVHLVLLETGYLAAQPNHKIKFGRNAPENFPRFKKMKTDWRV